MKPFIVKGLLHRKGGSMHKAIIALGIGIFITAVVVLSVLGTGLAQGEGDPVAWTPEQINRMPDEWRFAHEGLVLRVAAKTGRPLFEDLTFMSKEEAETGVWQ